MPDETNNTVPLEDRIKGTICQLPGVHQLAKLKLELEQQTNDSPAKDLDKKWNAFIQEVQVTLGTYLKLDNVSVLLGAGASRYAGGELIGSIPLSIEQTILSRAIRHKRISPWIWPFYSALRSIAPAANIPEDRGSLFIRFEQLQAEPVTAAPIAVNYEATLTRLYQWYAAALTDNNQIVLRGNVSFQFTGSQIKQCISNVKEALALSCKLPAPNHDIEPHRQLLRRLLTRPLNLRRPSLFTLNYDTLLEQAADQEGSILLDGFTGSIKPVFRPESYDQDLYFPGETTEGRVHRLDKVLHLYKLHGSLNWIDEEGSPQNPYGIVRTSNEDVASNSDRLLIYPATSKLGDMLGMPYAELFRRFAASIVRPQSVLITIGYAFGDEHVNAIIHQALSISSFTLIVVDPKLPQPERNGTFLERLRYRSESDTRIAFIGGPHAGTFEWFVGHMLPDLKDEQIQKRVSETYKALSRTAIAEGQDNAQ